MDKLPKIYEQASNLQFEDFEILVNNLVALKLSAESKPLCQLCGKDWWDETLYIEELEDERDNISMFDKCLGCRENT